MSATHRRRVGPIMKNLLGIVLAGAALSAALTAPATAAPAAPTAAKCTTLEVTGATVAVRRPARDANSATTSDPVDHYVHRGDRLESCLSTFNRTTDGQPLYHECGHGGSDWYLVRGGQIPETCVREIH
ncbi:MULTISPECIES: hypothetical protein [unclassified Streptomyces]|uniref:hypothetical protein n=1 Tax=unclassified Streptomyces TaxID=2593676 RepID=UPI00381905C5